MKYLKSYKLFLESKDDKIEFPEIFKNIQDILGNKTEDIEIMLDKLDDYLESNDDDMIADKLYDDLYNVYLDIEAAQLIEKLVELSGDELKDLDLQSLYDKCIELSKQDELKSICDDLIEVIEDLDMLDGADDINESKKKKRRKKRNTDRKDRNNYNVMNYYNREYYPFGYYNNFLRPYYGNTVNNYNTTNNDNDTTINGDVNIGGDLNGSIGGDVSVGGDMGGE